MFSNFHTHTKIIKFLKISELSLKRKKKQKVKGKAADQPKATERGKKMTEDHENGRGVRTNNQLKECKQTNTGTYANNLSHITGHQGPLATRG